MSQLILSCHIGAHHINDDPIPTEPFKRITHRGNKTDATCYRVENLTAISTGDHTTVYRASLLGHPSEKVLDVVLKTDVDARYPRSDYFQYEAKMYEDSLARMQSHIIPICYGLFQATLYDKLVSILVLEYCGKPLQYDSRTPRLDLDLRIDVFDLVHIFHQYGFQHNDVAPRNVLYREEDDGLFLVDLENVKPHDCGMKMNVLIGDFKPFILDFGCSELYYHACSLNMWEPSLVEFYGYKIPVSQFKPGRAENVVNALPSFMRDNENARAVLIAAAEADIRVIEAIREELRQVVTDEDRIYKPRPPSELFPPSDE